MEFPIAYSMFIPVVLLALLIFYAIRGYKNGLLLELVMVASLLVSLVASYLVSIALSESGFVFQTSINVGEVHVNQALDKSATQLITFFIFFIVINLAFYILRKLSKKFNDIIVVGTINQILGSILAVLKGSIYIILVVLLLASPLISNGREVLKQAHLEPVKECMQENIPVIKDVLTVFDKVDTINE